MRNQCTPPLPVDAIVRAERLNVPLLLDGLEVAKIEISDGGCMAMEAMSVERGTKAVGTVVTVEMDDGDSFPIHVASYGVKEDGYVMATDGKGYVSRAYFGDLIMGVCQAAEFKGMVIDSRIRSHNGNVEFEFPMYDRGFMSGGSIKKGEGNTNTPIMCGGVKVGPGDLVADDSDSVCVIPREYIETVLSEAEKKLAYEESREKTIAAYRKVKVEGREPPQLVPQQVLNMLQAK